MKVSSIILLTLLLISIKPEQAAACNCSEMSVKDAMKYSDIVFDGIVLSKIITFNLSNYGVKIVGVPDGNSFAAAIAKAPVAIFKIQVSKVYKGKSSSDTITVITYTTGGACGVSFQVGARYIVYGTTNESLRTNTPFKRYSTNKQTYWAHQCSRTAHYSEDEIRAIKSNCGKSR